MIVDCHTQIWDAKTQERLRAELAVCADADRHLEAVSPVDRAIVLGFKSAYLQAEIPNEFISAHVRRHSSKLVGFAGIDPTTDDCLDDLHTAQDELGLKGVTVSPALQNFHPADTRAMAVYQECEKRGMPVLFEQNHRNRDAKLEFALPRLLDEVAREFPNLKIVIAHMGYPWASETVVLLGKHRNVFADVSGLLPRPWLSYNALLPAFEFDVMDKLLFGSDFPYRAPAACIEALYSINQLSNGTNLVAIPREKLRGIVERDTLALLGIESAVRPARKPAHLLIDDD